MADAAAGAIACVVDTESKLASRSDYSTSRHVEAIGRCCESDYRNLINGGCNAIEQKIPAAFQQRGKLAMLLS
jgi:hypothetical protein